jgi:hypothetical protein
MEKTVPTTGGQEERGPPEGNHAALAHTDCRPKKIEFLLKNCLPENPRKTRLTFTVLREGQFILPPHRNHWSMVLKVRERPARG